MKTGKTLTELAAEIERRAESKKDFITPVEKLSATVETVRDVPTVVVNLAGQDSFPIAPYAHGQFASYLDIPKRYYDRMNESKPQLLADNINHWLTEHAGERRMIRTLDGKMRALLSDRFRPLENEDLAEAILPVLQELRVMVVSAEITDRKFYIKAVDESIQRDIPKGHAMGDGSHVFFDTISPGITISNSEIGAGTLSIETSVWTSACTNLCTFGASMRKYHTGKRADVTDEVYALLSDDTKRVSDEATWLQARDITRAAFERVRFDALAQKMTNAGQDKIEDSPVEVVERVRKRFTWTESESESVLTHLIQGGDLTRYGLHAAVTRASADFDSYDRASEFERLGGDIIELPKNDWAQLAAAA